MFLASLSCHTEIFFELEVFALEVEVLHKRHCGCADARRAGALFAAHQLTTTPTHHTLCAAQHPNTADTHTNTASLSLLAKKKTLFKFGFSHFYKGKKK